MRRLNGFYVMPRVRLRADQLLAGPNGGPNAREYALEPSIL